MASWRDMLNANKRPKTVRVSRNGQVVLPAQAREVAGIRAGDLLVAVPVAPGAVLFEKVDFAGGRSFKEIAEETEELRGLWGDDPDAWLDELRGEWRDLPGS
jgi:AbrB family looped-hinge helix DNA binding protein